MENYKKTADGEKQKINIKHNKQKSSDSKRSIVRKHVLGSITQNSRMLRMKIMTVSKNL